ncbi:MAG TPA: Fe-S protein assembly co-chaperone HscB [Methylophilus sp.]|mgnify:CR=1 FL=1|nr:Fe-S protein assembly co-chaperone HscB [Methylophilus sp.]HQQ32800.1 Fe-S protein assembly co-chaperone HscB [Methylophilus sp.]
MQNYFQLFQLPQQFDIDLTKLETSYRAIQTASHPDRYVTASDAEKLVAIQTATSANEAYKTLKNPALRAEYLLSQQGIIAIAETNTAMPADFLMQQMEWREAIEDAENAKDISALDRLLVTIRSESKALQQMLTKQFKRQMLSEATDTTRKLIFMEKVQADIRDVIEKLEG